MTSTSNNKFSIQNLFNVQDWVVVVSGGGTGIGLMIAQAFANNGARVYILGRREDALRRAVEAHGGSALAHQNGKIIPMQVDITSKESLEQFVRQLASHERHVDVLVNNAGVSEGTSEVEKGDESPEALRRELWDEKPEDWESVYRTNVMGHFWTTVALIPLLAAASKTKPNHTGGVINISSISGITKMSQHHFKYNVSKAASVQLTSQLAHELRRSAVKIRVNGIAPGIFPSEMTTGTSDEANISKIDEEGWADKKGIPAGRAGSDVDMAQAALMLACNQYAYGQTVAIDGGYLLEHV